MRWDPYVFSRQDRFTTFWADHLSARKRSVLLIAGLGFDPRATDIAEAVLAAGGAGARDCWLLCYDNYQVTTPEQQASVAANSSAFARLFAPPRKLEKLPVAMRSDRGRSTTCANTKAAISRPTDLAKYDDVIVDVSAMPRMIALMAVAQLLALFDAQIEKDRAVKTPNLHVAASESVAQDVGVTTESLDEEVTSVIGFSGRLGAESLDNPKVWIPILGEGQGLRLSRIYARLQPDEICPVLPFPSRNPRRGDGIIEEHRQILFDEFSVEPRNILHASEYNPFEAYREVFQTIDRYRNALSDLGDCRVFVSPLSSKLLSIGALLACYDQRIQKTGQFHVGIPYVEAASYGPSQPASNADKELSSMWLTGEWEK
jgi:hypothetical protein